MTKEQDDIDRMNAGFGAALAITESVVDQMAETCTWFQESDDSDPWETTCGRYFSIEDGPPSQNGMKFCCYCGKPLEEVPYKESES